MCFFRLLVVVLFKIYRYWYLLYEIYIFCFLKDPVGVIFTQENWDYNLFAWLRWKLAFSSVTFGWICTSLELRINFRPGLALIYTKQSPYVHIHAYTCVGTYLHITPIYTYELCILYVCALCQWCSTLLDCWWKLSIGNCPISPSEHKDYALKIDLKYYWHYQLWHCLTFISVSSVYLETLRRH